MKKKKLQEELNSLKFRYSHSNMFRDEYTALVECEKIIKKHNRATKIISQIKERNNQLEKENQKLKENIKKYKEILKMMIIISDNGGKEK